MSLSTASPTLRSVFVVCSDLEKSQAFYENLGFHLLTKKSRSIVISAGPGLELHLHSPLKPDEEKLFGMSCGQGSSALVQSFVVQNLDQVAAQTDQDQVLFGPAHTPWGDRILLVKDPDGHRLEFREGRI